MHRIAPPAGERVFDVECGYLRSIRNQWKRYAQMDNGEKRAFLWALGTWQEYRDKIMFYRIPPNLEKYPYKSTADKIDMIIADMLAECAGIEVIGRSVDQRLGEFEECIRTLDTVQEERKIWY